MLWTYHFFYFNWYVSSMLAKGAVHQPCKQGNKIRTIFQFCLLKSYKNSFKKEVKNSRWTNDVKKGRNEMLCSSSKRWAVRPLSHPNRMNKILLLFFRPQRISFLSSSSSSSSSRTNIILKSQSESETHINTIIMEDEVSKQKQKEATRRSMEFLSSKPYVPPQWASHLNPIPSHIFSLAHVK